MVRFRDARIVMKIPLDTFGVDFRALDKDKAHR